MSRLIWPVVKVHFARFFSRDLARLALTALFLGSALLVETPALAQDGTYNPTQPCTPWPQCAAQPQGQGGGGSGGQPAMPPPPTHRWINVAIAAATHPDANDAWVIWDTGQNVKRVEADVVAACTRSMGAGCKVEMSGTNGSITVARNANGWLILGWGTSANDASKAALKQCQTEKMQCTVQKSYTAKAWQKRIGGNEPDRIKTYFPDINAYTLKLALVTWPSSAPQDPRWFGKTWLSTGTRGRVAAERKAMEKCAQDTGTQCVIGQGSIGGVIMRFRASTDGKFYYASALSRSDAEETLKEYCRLKMDGAKCYLETIFDSETEAEIIVDDGSAAG